MDIIRKILLACNKWFIFSNVDSNTGRISIYLSFLSFSFSVPLPSFLHFLILSSLPTFFLPFFPSFLSFSLPLSFFLSTLEDLILVECDWSVKNIKRSDKLKTLGSTLTLPLLSKNQKGYSLFFVTDLKYKCN